MALRVIKEHDPVQTISYALPNKHYIAVDMSYLGVDNISPEKAEVFAPVSAPRYVSNIFFKLRYR